MHQVQGISLAISLILDLFTVVNLKCVTFLANNFEMCNISWYINLKCIAKYLDCYLANRLRYQIVPPDLILMQCKEFI